MKRQVCIHWAKTGIDSQRVTVLETTVKDNLPEIKSALIKIQERLEKNDK